MYKNAGVWGGLFFLLFSLVFLGTSLQYDFFIPQGGIGPGFLPFWLCLFLALFSLVYLIDALKNNPVPISTVLPDQAGRKTILFLLLYMVLFMMIVKSVGFTMAASLMLFLMFKGYFKWYVNLGVSLGTSLFLYWVFVIWLMVPLPVNVFGW
ncbi:tripartite tricarboxylate transporter TctB family protein [Candidatus Formimonas warabiya]|uniref:DUF1468 domain-containing protein n=1 Tax=Formimonas warabiya TaxID=1761012 RepID=A0A3G1KZB0_FORW1|nr:tripartite tricarboxylate transporter TctB family protein [Candidatus Formimonas warabiya]ATW27876.1 hypothetical protein DCMF_26750 [Candidatus Formimonas warabiya]